MNLQFLSLVFFILTVVYTYKAIKERKSLREIRAKYPLPKEVKIPYTLESPNENFKEHNEILRVPGLSEKYNIPSWYTCENCGREYQTCPPSQGSPIFLCADCWNWRKKRALKKLGRKEKDLYVSK